jgi:hypothetical protein
MDPNYALKRLDYLVSCHVITNETDCLCHDLFDWIKKGGFEPEWNRYPSGTMYYNCMLKTLKGN